MFLELNIFQNHEEIVIFDIVRILKLNIPFDILVLKVANVMIILIIIFSNWRVNHFFTK